MQAWGNPEAPVMARSSNKPLQALAMLRAGLELTSEQLAVTCASHSGEDIHLAAVRSILERYGLTEADLRNTPDLPLDDQAKAAWIRAGRDRTSLAQNCSGKHASMLATCVANGWDRESYLEADHPLQLAITKTIEEIAGEPMAADGVDGCGAPLVAFSLVGLAQAFSRLMTSDAPLERQIVAAMSRNPELVSGTRRDSAALVRAIPGAIAKEGAEGVYAVGLPDGRALALKILDGAQRPRATVMVALLAELGLTGLEGTAAESGAVLGGGQPVGSIRLSL